MTDEKTSPSMLTDEDWKRWVDQMNNEEFSISIMCPDCGKPFWQGSSNFAIFALCEECIALDDD